jgi:hypothetical protein
VENTVNANALVSVRNAVGRSWNDLPSSPEESTEVEAWIRSISRSFQSLLILRWLWYNCSSMRCSLSRVTFLAA